MPKGKKVSDTPSLTKRIFISYRHREPDRILAAQFSNELKKVGFEVLLDDKDIKLGSDWVQSIKNKIEQSNYFLLLLTRESAKSEFTLEEISLAKDQNKTIFPVRINYPFNEPLPYILSIYLRTIQQEYWKNENDTLRIVNKILDSEGGQSNSNTCSGIEVYGTGGLQQTMPQPYFDPRNITIPGGAVDSNIYIKRQADEDAIAAIQQHRGIATVRGPRQTGKTSLLMRVYCEAKKQRIISPAFVDFQAFTLDKFQSSEMIWRTIAIKISEQVKLKKWKSSFWDVTSDYDDNFSDFLENYVFEKTETPLLICFDEVDRLFQYPVRDEFFASVRAFYNRGAIDDNWNRVRWLLSTSSEPSFFINDLSQSPFNIGFRIDLNAFSYHEIAEFAMCYHLNPDDDFLKKIMDFVGGRPYLVHLLLYHLNREPESFDKIFDVEYSSRNIFRDHLNRYHIHFQKEKKLAHAMKDIIIGIECNDPKIINRLEAAGLVRYNKINNVTPYCRLYKEYFERELE